MSTRHELPPADLTPYTPLQADGPLRLRLDKNEGRLAWRPDSDFWLRQTESLPHYPDDRELTARIAERLGVVLDRVLVTAGGDDALQRIAAATLESNRDMLLATPSFEMLPRYARQVRGGVVTVPWGPGPYPSQSIRAAFSRRTGVVVVVSPNNPTGQAITAAEFQELAEAVAPTPLLLDLAYTEFADEDLFPLCATLPNVLAVRTFSKARGLAGLRVGYVVATPEWIARLRCFGNPYAVSRLSLAVATENLARGEAAVAAYVQRIREERRQLATWLPQHGVAVWPSQANFVLARFADGDRVWRSLAAAGIAVRKFPESAELQNCLRITLPGQADEFATLLAALAKCPLP